MVQDCWLVRSRLLLQTLLTNRGPDGGLRVAPDHGSLSGGGRAYLQPVKRGADLQMDEVRPRWALVLPLLVQNCPSWRPGAMSTCTMLNPPF